MCFDFAVGRLAGNVIMTGNVLLNGKKTRLDYGGVVSIHEYISFSSMDFKSKQPICRKNVFQ